MIRRLRRRHGWLAPLSFTAAAVAVAIGASLQRPDALDAEIPARIEAPVIDAEQLTWLVGTLEGGEDGLRYHFMLLTSLSGASVTGMVARLDAPTALADVVVHWTPSPSNRVGDALWPDGARLLGALPAGREVILPLPSEALALQGRLLVTSLAHGERLLDLELSSAERPDGAGR